MTIEQENKIDIIGIDKMTGDCVLIISDHLDWDDMNSHLLSIQTKINSYLEFIESKQVYEDYPEAKGKKLTVNIVAKECIPQEIYNEYYEKFSNALNEYGVLFKWGQELE